MLGSHRLSISAQTIQALTIAVAVFANSATAPAQQPARQPEIPDIRDPWSPPGPGARPDAGRGGAWRRMEPTAPWRNQRVRRHRKFMLDGVPDGYQGQTNPLKPTQTNIRAGGAIYAGRCAACHGARGQGDGEDGKGLSPSPALLARLVRRPVLVDEYLLWTIADGGASLGTDMPAFKHDLTAREIWRVIHYMRAGFPSLVRR